MLASLLNFLLPSFVRLLGGHLKITAGIIAVSGEVLVRWRGGRERKSFEEEKEGRVFVTTHRAKSSAIS
jgi:hypothetical protein